MEQGRLWDEPAPAEPRRRPTARRSTAQRVEAQTLPLWAEPPAGDEGAAAAQESDPARADPADPEQAAVLATPARSTSDAAVGGNARSTTGTAADERAGSSAGDAAGSASEPGAVPAAVAPARRPSPLSPPPAAPASRVRPQRPSAPEPDMESLADSLEELLEAGGAPARNVKPFLAVCPPTSRWEQPEGFMPRPGSYAQAVRDVLAGRRRVRIAGQDDTEVTASKDSAGAWELSP